MGRIDFSVIESKRKINFGSETPSRPLGIDNIDIVGKKQFQLLDAPLSRDFFFY